MPSYVITGANRGIGLAFVRQLSAKSENIVIALVRNISTTDGLKSLNRSNVHILQADIGDLASLKRAAADTAKITGGSLDVLINNAAMLPNERDALPLDGYPEAEERFLAEDLVALFTVNVVGVVHTINSFLPLIKKGSSKKVIVISSGVGDLDLTLASGHETSGPYSISKAAVNMAVAKYAAEYKSQGIFFLAISPGLVDTATRAPTAKELEDMQKMVTKFKKVAPNWQRPLTPDESVEMMLKVFDDLTLESSGAFLSHKGNKEWL
ncbi:NAD(P)-binding protein [Dentipellis sp. KUC8613]|nr:NAD(P)-binding protein [Dentipellis sp. KUC8613]